MNKAENLKIEDLKVGFTREFEVIITEEMVKQFAVLSGDFNPLHMDDNYAKNTRFKKRLVHGMLLSAFFSRLVGMHLPGKYSLYIMQNLKFKNPAFIGDTLKIKGKIISISEKLKLFTLETIILNSTGQTIIEGEAKVSFLGD